MENNYAERMVLKTDEDLQLYLDNFLSYTPEAIMAAKNELERRGRIFSEEEIASIDNKISEKEKIVEPEKNKRITRWNRKIVTDQEAPMLYSERAINAFSFFFSVLVGVIFLSKNLKKLGLKKERKIVVISGIAYFTIGLIVLTQLPRSTPLSLAFNGFGAYILSGFFWKKYIGELKYRTKPIWIPLIICILIFIPLVWAMIMAGDN